MLLKESWLHVTDNTNVRWIKIFHLYKGFHRKSTSQGFFIKGSARVVEPPRIEYKGFKYKYNIKGDICRLLIVRVVLRKTLKDGLESSFNTNAGISIKKKSEPKSKYLNGPINRSINRRKIISLFPYVI